MNPLLEARGVTVRFGGLTAVNDVSLSIGAGEFVALVGPNGAGKTTLFNAFSGHVAPAAGKVVLAGHDITGASPAARARMGLVRTWQIPRPFARLSVLDNVMVGIDPNPGAGMGRALLGATDPAPGVARARAALETVGLSDKRDLHAGRLSGGERKLLELARALVLEPKVLLLDEPFAGVNPTLARGLMDVLLGLWRSGRSLVLVEHNMELVMAHCPRIVVLAQGAVLRDGDARAVHDDPRVIEAYLGGTL